MSTIRLVADTPPRRDQRARRCLDPLAPLFVDLVPFVGLDDLGAGALLRDLAFSLAALITGKDARVVVPTEAISLLENGRRGPVWEVGLERDGEDVLVTLFRQGAAAEVAQAERRVVLSSARQAVLTALGTFTTSDKGLAMAREALLAASDDQPARARRAARCEVVIESTVKSRLRISATTRLRAARDPGEIEVARTDLHALLCRGDVELTLGASSRRLRAVHLFLVAEHWLELAEAALAARRAGRGMMRRLAGGGVTSGIQVGAHGRAVLLLGSSDHEAGAERLPPLDALEVVRALVSFARRLGKHIALADPGQRSNLRLDRMRRRARSLAEELTRQGDDEDSTDSIINPTPETYRAFAESTEPSAVTVQPSSAKLRFTESWRADVPGLDLHAFFVAGPRVIAGSPREIACIERRSGALLWTRRTHRAVSVMTPAGLVRLGADGKLSLHDMGDGEPLFELQLAACVGASTSGAVVAAPGLPTMLLVAEGARHLVAVDLDSHEVRWRRAVRARPSASRLRLRRAGKLMVVDAGESTLLALDLLTGEVVWRHRGRGAYQSLLVDRGELYALSAEKTQLTVERLEAWTGARCWRTRIARPVHACAPPLCTTSAIALITRDRDRTGIATVDRATGAVRVDRPGGLTAGRAACLAIDDTIVGNSDSGELVAVSADGELRYRHVFAGLHHLDPAERPRSHAPVLRSGALFLPQSELYVVRPADGALLGRLPSDLVADVVRVDEQCGVYLAEASGYIAAYHAMPMLTLVKRA